MSKLLHLATLWQRIHFETPLNAQRVSRGMHTMSDNAMMYIAKDQHKPSL
jgi:hypothetical protein